MIPNGYPVLSLLLFALLTVLSHGQSPSGFISIDCGIAGGVLYTDDRTTIDYTSDESHVQTGENWNVSSEIVAGLRYRTLRSFPNGTRNCYTLRPAQRGKKYLVRAEFLYGNYDGLNRPPVFDLYLGADLWGRVNTSSRDGRPVRMEIIAVATADSVPVCLVNTGSGVPFVSVIELRPLADEIYGLVNASQSLVLFEERRDFGGRPSGGIRYPDDPYDRLWFTPATTPVGWSNLSTSMQLTAERNGDIHTPSAVMRTSVTTGSVSEYLEFGTAPSLPADEIYVYLHFAELRQLRANETREMDIYLNGEVTQQGFTPQYLFPTSVFTTNPGINVRHDYSIRASNRSTLPPVINAMEVYVLRRQGLEGLPTSGGDEDQLTKVRAVTPVRFYAIDLNGTTGFISIDCGIPRGTRSTDEEATIVFMSDEEYVDTGENRRLPPEFRVRRQYQTLRSFPSGARNCYRLRPVQRGKKYLVRAAFLYGNYDGLGSSPIFDLHLGVNPWATVNASSPDGNPVTKEIITVAPGDSVSVCLVNTGSGVPFVSSIELRPLLDSIYPLANASQSLVLFENRRDFGGRPSGLVRYPDDPYDRLWFTPTSSEGWLNMSTDFNVTNQWNDMFEVPSAVMRTAATTRSMSETLDFSTTLSSAEDAIYIFMYFAELRQLGANETRELVVYMNGRLWAEVTPFYLFTLEVFTDNPGSMDTREFSVRASERSTLPPLVNAVEVYALKRVQAQPTHDGDVDAILNVKEFYGIRKNWEGDPCVPQNFTWEGLTCTYDTSPRITSLNLTSSGLKGGIDTSFVNLTNIRSLDLSHNDLTGEIPEFLTELTSLQVLNLSGNKLTGLVPQPLLERSRDRSLLLSIEGNPDLCYREDSCQKKKKKKNVIPIIVATSATFVVLVLLALLCASKRRHSKTRKGPSVASRGEHGSHLLSSIDSESRQFTYSEIVSMTNNFEKEIGRGGFGTVFHGWLKDGRQVAVKMLSKLSSQGEKEFRAEVLTLIRVHHRNLVPLLGYCDEKENLALVYEYMAHGCLVDHLKGKERDCNSLSWSARMRIALEAAQGLEYLHSGCKPPIIHRDVKTANILLNQNLEAKIADFGLSKAFTNEDHSHISTKTVAGTLGYLDPEYQLTSQLNEKSDVYSFGVVLLELITGKPPVVGDTEKIHIARWVHQKVLESGDISSIADPNLQGEYDHNSIWKAVEVAISCASASPAQRPTMSQVVIQLKECQNLSVVPVEYRFGTEDTTIEMIPLHSDTMTVPTAR
ncbi:hypothetical protein Taro_025883 [Colocasia esculenta]|uniref:non-specific serine/threonine protein kinase n=1 Tax=Colocasia esculenta TaxID=4460 RepID=A0A843VBE0_COLES|nr:hypothetical protein [Colocasia esculenta]